MYQEIQRMLHGEDNMKNRARLQYLISSMSMMNGIFSRTRKREVTTDMSQAERKPHRRKVELTTHEREEFDRVIEQYIDERCELQWQTLAKPKSERLLKASAVIATDFAINPAKSFPQKRKIFRTIPTAPHKIP
jgi:hypothetical protein